MATDEGVCGVPLSLIRVGAFFCVSVVCRSMCGNIDQDLSGSGRSNPVDF